MPELPPGYALATVHRLETIYRNNLGSSYNEASARILEEPDVHEVIPLVMLNEIRDRRTRGNPNGLYPDRGFHWQMDGFVGTMSSLLMAMSGANYIHDMAGLMEADLTVSYEKLAMDKFMARPLRQETYQTCGNLVLTFDLPAESAATG